MPTEDTPANAVKHWQEYSDVYDFLEQIRLRPGTWLPGCSLQHLQSILTGYRVALAVHSSHEYYGMSSSLTWAAEIERHTPADSTPIDEFFRLLDNFRRDTAQVPAPQDTTDQLPGVEYMSNAFVTLLRRRHLLTDAVQQLADRGFRVVHLAAIGWTTEEDMHRSIAATLRFPDYYGHNLDALNDCLGDVACFGPYDDDAESTGLVLAFTDYDRFATADPGAAQIVLDIMANQARRAAVVQRRFFALIHSNDPDIRFEPVGAMPVCGTATNGSTPAAVENTASAPRRTAAHDGSAHACPWTWPLRPCPADLRGPGTPGTAPRRAQDLPHPPPGRIRRGIQSNHPEPLDPLTGRTDTVKGLQHVCRPAAEPRYFSTINM
ncbi:barstar family protein [Streptomyces sp. NPDC051569]|uniref:barstar family protein n=1 Tax=Streptomyces sp. NPDC051569 TaxID=3365661 RepID=UPI003799F0DD